MQVEPRDVALDRARRLRRPQRSGRVAEQKDLAFKTEVDADLPDAHPHRSAAAAAGPQEPALQRLQVHRRAARCTLRVHAAQAGHALRRTRRCSERPASSRFTVTDTGIGIAARQAAAHLRGLPAGGRHHQPQVRRHRPGAVDQPRDRAAAGRRDPRRERGRARAARSRSTCPSTTSAGAPTRALAAVQRRWAPRAARPSPHVVGTPTALAEPRPDRDAEPIEDDRASIREGDRVLLVIEDDVKFARIMLQMAREKGFKVVVATRGDTGLALANELPAGRHHPGHPAARSWTAGRVLDRLKRNPRTRHIPVHVISVDETSRRGAALGAFAYLEKPVSQEALEGAFEHITTLPRRQVRQLLLVEDDDTPAREHRRAGRRGRRRRRSRRCAPAEEALTALETRRVRLHGRRPAAARTTTASSLVEKVQARGALPRPAGRRLHRQGARRRRTRSALKKYAQSVILKSARALARAPAQRDRAVPPPRREPACPSARKAVAGGEPATATPRSRAARCWSSTTTSATSSR